MAHLLKVLEIFTREFFVEKGGAREFTLGCARIYFPEVRANLLPGVYVKSGHSAFPQPEEQGMFTQGGACKTHE